MANLYVTWEEYELLTPADIALVAAQGQEVVVVGSQDEAEEAAWEEINPQKGVDIAALTPEAILWRDMPADEGAPVTILHWHQEASEPEAEAASASALERILEVQSQLLTATQETNYWLRHLATAQGDQSGTVMMRVGASVATTGYWTEPKVEFGAGLFDPSVELKVPRGAPRGKPSSQPDQE